MEDTIAAISTALGVGAIAIIRVSGKNAIENVNKIFDKNLLIADSHTIHYGHILENNKIIDEVLISVMRAPKTFTKEDVVEINTHGGIATTNKVLELLLSNGCRLAQPGEFTKRAFLNGRIDLIEAEGVMDIIKSTTDRSLNLAINQLNGNVSKLIKNLRQDLIEVLANIEVNIDYPEYEDIEEITINDIKNKVNKLELSIKEIITNSKDANIIKDGIDTVIIGRPNVGKSSLLNRLLEEEKAIVTNIPGTTRDTVEGQLYIDGIKLNITDTAGIRDTEDIVEQIGVNKSYSLIDKSELVILMLNNNEVLNTDEEKLIEKIKNKNYIIVVNKIDLENKLDLDNENVIKISILNNEGIEKIKNKIKKMFSLDKFENKDLNYLSSTRGISILNECLKLVKDLKESINNNMPIDLLEIDIKNIWSKLGEIIGETYEDELIDQLFSQFCLGK